MSNDFKTFATSGTANVYTNAEYIADADTTNGNQPGIAKSKLVNKALRQCSIISTVIAQYIADTTGTNAVDDGTTATLLTNLKTATNVATNTHAATSKTTPVDADEFAIADSAASFGLKKLTWANIKTALVSLFAPLASPAFTDTPTAPTAVAGTNTTQIATTAFVLANGVVISKIQPITASVVANALTVTLNPTTLDFRSATLESGTVNTRTIASPISMTVSSGSTLGTVSAVASRLVLIAIVNAGTVELAIVNLSGGNNLDETTLISTTAEGGAGAADSASVIYSTNARTGVPFRVVGFLDITEVTAGTWTTAPSTIQGIGGQALAAMSSLGYGQAYRDVTVSRALSTTYTNTSGRPKFITVWGASTATATSGSLIINGITVDVWVVNNATAAGGSIRGLIPVGATYSVFLNTALTKWFELS